MFIDLREREKHGEKHRFVASHMHPDQESNLQPFAVGDHTPTNRARAGFRFKCNEKP